MDWILILLSTFWVVSWLISFTYFDCHCQHMSKWCRKNFVQIWLKLASMRNPNLITLFVCHTNLIALCVCHIFTVKSFSWKILAINSSLISFSQRVEKRSNVSYCVCVSHIDTFRLTFFLFFIFKIFLKKPKGVFS